MFKIKTGYYLELLTPEKIKLLGRTESKTTKDKSGENVPHLEITEVVLIHCNIVNNDYQQDSRVLYKCFPNKPFGSLLEFAPTHFIPLYTKVWFTDQNIQSLEIEDRINLNLVINWYRYHENAFFNWTQKSNIFKRLWIFVFC